MSIPTWLIQMGSVAAMILATLLPVINPLGAAPIFLSLTSDVDAKAQAYIARYVAIYAAIINTVALLLGSYILTFFGISEGAVRVGGGLLLCAFAWKQLNSPDAPSSADSSDVNQKNTISASSLRARAFFPLAFPMTTGPGCVSVAITLGAHVWGVSGKAAKWSSLGGAFLGVFLVALTIFICYRFAARIVAYLGDTGARVLMRMAAFILLCIGVQILWEGIEYFVRTLSL